MPRMELRVDHRELWRAYADRLYSGDKVVKSVTEMLQNSVDAGSSRVDISLKPDKAGHWLLAFDDDGHGMTEEVFLDRFLCLGGKGPAKGSLDDGRRTGGNGVAKAIILFNQYVQDFSIESVAGGRRFIATREQVLSGAELVGEPSDLPSGVRYRILLKVDQPPKLEAVCEVLGYAIVRTKIVFNGVEIGSVLRPSRTLSAIAGYPVFDGPKESHFKSRLYVLSNGLPQFTEWISDYMRSVVIDLRPTTYLDFTPARERVLNADIRKMVEKLLERIRYEYENPLSAAGVKEVRRRFAYNFQCSKKKVPAAPIVDAVPALSSAALDGALVAIEAQSVEGTVLKIPPPQESLSAELEKLIPSRGVIIEDCTVQKDEWHPELTLKGRRFLALMDRYLEVFEGRCSVEIANIGLTRGHHDDGYYHETEKAILIDVSKLDCSWRSASRQLLFLLVHELTHFWYKSHNEYFTSKEASLLKLAASCWHRFEQARKSVRDVR